ncbi:MAG: hypothetical protein LBD11_07765 [Candidatus Peribacteria bacterium]|nr:hypothetical protein [Candidatus Peribacteria bacterium]
MMKKVETTAMYSLEELKNEQFEIFKKSRISEGIEKIKGEVNRAKGNLSSAETAYKTLPEPMREKAIAKAKSEYESEINKKKEEIKTEYSLR